MSRWNKAVDLSTYSKSAFIQTTLEGLVPSTAALEITFFFHLLRAILPQLSFFRDKVAVAARSLIVVNLSFLLVRHTL